MKNKWTKKTIRASCWTALFLSTTLACFAQVSPASNLSDDNKIAAGTIIEAELLTKLDAHKVHAGDRFEIALYGDLLGKNGILLNHGSRMVGRIVSVQLRGKEQPESKLVISMEKLVLGGSEVPLRAIITRLQRPVESVGYAAAPSDIATRGGSYHAQTNIPLSNDRLEKESRDPFKSIGGSSKPNRGPTFTPQPKKDGDLEIQIAGSDTALISAKHNVKLEPRSHLILQVVRVGD